MRIREKLTCTCLQAWGRVRRSTTCLRSFGLWRLAWRKRSLKSDGDPQTKLSWDCLRNSRSGRDSPFKSYPKRGSVALSATHEPALLTQGRDFCLRVSGRAFAPNLYGKASVCP